MEYEERKEYFTKEQIEMLKEIGFVQNEKYPYMFTHKLLGAESYDFSAACFEGIIKIVFNRGYDQGKQDLQNQFKTLMNF